MSDLLRILIVGDPEVGKSSIISTYTSRHFPDDGVPSVLYDSKLPPDSTANGTFVVIMDSNSRIGGNKVNSSLADKIIVAHSIVCVYDVTRPETLESIANEWLPLIRDVVTHAAVTNANNPLQGPQSIPNVIVAGNKTDLLGDLSDDLRMEEEAELKYFSTLLKDFPFVKYCCRCSAKMLDVDSVFYYAENVVTYPIDPLYDVTVSDFTGPAISAFKRVFRLFDEDHDGLLSDAEIAKLQRKCFQVEFANDEVVALKRHIIKDVPGGLSNNKITFAGFLGMIRKCIEKRSNLETAWIILKTCGYENSPLLSLELPPDVEELPLPLEMAEMEKGTVWDWVKSKLVIPIGRQNKLPKLVNVTREGVITDAVQSLEVQQQLHTLQEQQQYDAPSLSADAIEFLVSLCMVVENSVREKQRIEVSEDLLSDLRDGGENSTRTTGAQVLDQLSWNELSQRAIEEIFSVLPQSSFLFTDSTPVGAEARKEDPGLSTRGGVAIHPWSYPPLYCPPLRDSDSSNGTSTVYCMSGYYEYAVDDLSEMAGDFSISPHTHADVLSETPDSPITSNISLDTSSNGMSTEGGVHTHTEPAHRWLYTTISMWIAQWHMLAQFEPVLVQKLLYGLGYVEKVPHNHYGLVMTKCGGGCRQSVIKVINALVHSEQGRNAGELSQFLEELHLRSCSSPTVSDTENGHGRGNFISVSSVEESTSSFQMVRSGLVRYPCSVGSRVSLIGKDCIVRSCSVDVPELSSVLSSSSMDAIVKTLMSSVVVVYSGVVGTVSDSKYPCDLHLMLHDPDSLTSVEHAVRLSVRGDEVTNIDSASGGGSLLGLDLTSPRLFVAISMSNESTGTRNAIARQRMNEHTTTNNFHPAVEVLPHGKNVDSANETVASLLRTVYGLTNTTNSLHSVSTAARDHLMTVYRRNNSLFMRFKRLFSSEEQQGFISTKTLSLYTVTLACSVFSTTSLWYFSNFFVLKKRHPLLGQDGISHVQEVLGDSTLSIQKWMAVIQIIHRMVLFDLGTLYHAMLSYGQHLFSGMQSYFESLGSVGNWSLMKMYQHTFKLITSSK